MKHIPFISLLAFMWLMLVPGPDAYGQKTTITGHVYDAKTKEPLPFVNVAFKGTKVGTTTDINGSYSIDTYYSSDSLMASFVGYKPQAQKVKKDVAQSIDFFLQEGSVNLGEVVINAKDFENPAHVILRNIISHKPVNNRAKLEAYEYETYNKVQFDINNFGEKFTKRKIFNKFDFIFDYIDSSDAKVSLPFFMTENLSSYYYQQQPKGRKEIIRATKVSGINNESISQFLGQMYQDVNIYENSISIFGKNFVSPISNYGLAFYKYFLTDSTFIGDKWCYRLEFQPKNEAELVFKGHFWVNDTTYAIKSIDAEILKSANINFITELKVHHEYDEVEHEVWMLIKEDLLVDFSLLDKEMGFYGKKTTTYKDFVINQPKDPEFYTGAESVIVESQVNEKDNNYWEKARHEKISEDQQGVYNMVDSLKNNKIFMTYVDVVNFLIQGYRVHGPIEIGPVFTFLSYNSVEGVRPKFGLRTSNDFSTRLMLEGYGAYGFNDKEFKYMVGGSYFLSKKPRQIVGARYTRDMDLIGQVPNYFPRDHFVQFLTVRNPQDRLIFSEKTEVYIEREWFTGFSSRVDFIHSDMQARGDWEFTRLSPDDPIQEPTLVNNIIDSRVRIQTRFAFRESFVSGEFERISLGTRWPIINLTAELGMKGVFGSQYEYQKLAISVTDKIPLGPLGNFYFSSEAGKTWNPAPYPLLYVHNGNESLFFNSRAFNSMNFFEFVSDEYVTFRGEYHFEGFFLNKIPLFQKLKWRELIGINGLVGRFDDANLNEMLLPARTYALDNRPFAEAYIGVENIFKFIRVDAIWRLSYLDQPNARKFGILIGFDIQF
jgi:hypothetical protein